MQRPLAEYTEMYSRGRRGAPAKGVGRLSRRESSNLSISAKQKDTNRCPFCFGGRDLNRAPRGLGARPLAVRERGSATWEKTRSVQNELASECRRLCFRVGRRKATPFDFCLSISAGWIIFINSLAFSIK